MEEMRVPPSSAMAGKTDVSGRFYNFKNSTRRLLALPSAVALLAMGSEEPFPIGLNPGCINPKIFY
jgi:hypothetical protein